MAFTFTQDAKLALINTAAGAVGGIASFYSDRGALELGTMASLIIGAIIFVIAAYLEKSLFKGNDIKWYLSQGALVYILSWLVVNGLLTTF